MTNVHVFKAAQAWRAYFFSPHQVACDVTFVIFLKFLFSELTYMKKQAPFLFIGIKINQNRKGQIHSCEW